MYVCHCLVVSDREIRAALDCGARDECAVARFCGAGSRCGGCLPAIRTLMAERGIAADDTLDAVAIREALLASR